MNRDFRELQVSTTALIFIILGVIILGTVIFFLGVQVGKKQADLLNKTLLSQKTEEKVTSPTPVVPAEESQTAQSATATSTAEKPAESTSLTGTSGQIEKADSQTIQSQPVARPTSSSQPASSTPRGETKAPEPAKTASPSSTPKTASSTSASRTSTGSFFIQVGAYADRTTAQLAAERFKKLGHSALVKDPFPKDRKPIYRVWVGGFRTREEAQKVLNELNASSARRTGYFIVQQ